MSDARQVIADFYKIDTDDETILRHEQLRVRVAVYDFTLDSDPATNVKLTGLKDPEILSVTVLCEDGADNWAVYDYRAASDSGTSSFRVSWRGQDHATNPNEIQMNEVGTTFQGNRARIVVFYVERGP